MTQKILLTIEIDDSQLDAAQEKVQTLIELIQRAQVLLDELERSNARIGNAPAPDWDWRESVTCRLCP